MKTLSFKISILLFAVLILNGCKKRKTEELSPAEFNDNPAVFIDNFSSGLNYAAFGGSNPRGFQVDEEVAYNGTEASMRFEVPDLNDPKGAYVGGCFFTSVGRNLSKYDALTFWIKASQAANIDIMGFGNDLGLSQYQVSISNVPVNASWNKIIIPIPDASLLTAERGMFFYSEGPENDRGYTFWIDEVKFEKLGTISNIRPSILSGDTQTVNSFNGISLNISGLSCYFNLPNGTDTEVGITPAYYNFKSSNPDIASINSLGNIQVNGGPGSAIITATVGGKNALGQLTVNSIGSFQNSPNPIHNASDVISLFSDAYTNVVVDYYNGYWAPFQTTLSADFSVNGNNILHYTNFNFVGIQFSNPTIDASSMTHLRADIFIPNAIVGSPTFKIQLVDFGANGAFGGGDDKSHTITYTAANITAQNWISFDIPLANFTTLTSKAHLGQLIFEGTNIPSFYADNIYLRR